MNKQIIELLKLWRQDSSKSNKNSMGFPSSHACLFFCPNLEKLFYLSVECLPFCVQVVLSVPWLENLPHRY